MASTQGPKVVYLVCYPMGARDAKRFGLAHLQAAGIPVQVWDCSHFYYPAVGGLGIQSPSWVDLTLCTSVDHFRRLCSTLTEEHVVILTGGFNQVQSWQGRRLLRLLSATPARLATTSLGHAPTPTLEGHGHSAVGGRAARITSLLTDPMRWPGVTRRVAESVFVRTVAPRRRLRIRGFIRPLDRIWAGTMIAGIESCFIAPSTRVTYIHTLDYDLVLEVRAGHKSATPHVVFIDSMGPLHPDGLAHGYVSPISIETYSQVVCRGLEKVERQLGCEVVIAGHPRAHPGTMEPWYGGRTVLYGQTAQLIANALAVVAINASTTIGLAAVFRRPLVLLATSELGADFDCSAFSEALATPLINLSAPDLAPIDLEVDDAAYERYVQHYIKRDGTPEEPFWSVVASEIISDAAH